MKRWLKSWGGVALCAACATPQTLPAPAPPALPVLATWWVDASCAAGGVGTEEAPFKTLAEALARGPARIELRSGLYRGPFALPAGTSLRGHGAVVLYAEAEPQAVLAAGSVTVEDLTVQGGQTGIRLEAGGELSHLSVEGARQAGLVVAGGEVHLQGVRFRASFAESLALAVEGGSVQGTSCLFEGPFRHGVDVAAAGRLVLHQPRFEGSVTGVQVMGGSALVDKGWFHGGRGPALFVTRGALNVTDTLVDGQEYAVLARDGARLTVHGLTCTHAQRAGFGLVGVIAELQNIHIANSGTDGAMQLVGGDVTLRDFDIRNSAGAGITARQGHLRLERGSLVDVTDEGGGTGSGVELRALDATLEDVTVRNTAGAGVVCAETAQVRLERVSVESSGTAGVEVDSFALVRAHSLTVRHVKGPALLLPGRSSLRIDGLEAADAQLLVWAECNAGALVHLTHVHTDLDVVPSPCVAF
jgi:hypothetical protein